MEKIVWTQKGSFLGCSKDKIISQMLITRENSPHTCPDNDTVGAKVVRAWQDDSPVYEGLQPHIAVIYSSRFSGRGVGDWNSMRDACRVCESRDDAREQKEDPDIVS